MEFLCGLAIRIPEPQVSLSARICLPDILQWKLLGDVHEVLKRVVLIKYV